MLNVINVGSAMQLKYMVQQSAIFERGMIGQLFTAQNFLGTVYECGVSDGSNPCGIIDDTKMPQNNTTQSSGLVKVWPFVSGLEFETDQFDISNQYTKGDPLYAGTNGIITNRICVYQIGTVLDITVAPVGYSCILRVSAITPQLTTVNMVPVPITFPTTNTFGGGGGWSSGTITVSGGASGASNTGFFTTVRIGGFNHAGITDISKNVSTIITMPNGETGSKCQKCGVFNAYLQDDNYTCTGCKMLGS